MFHTWDKHMWAVFLYILCSLSIFTVFSEKKCIKIQTRQNKCAHSRRRANQLFCKSYTRLFKLNKLNIRYWFIDYSLFWCDPYTLPSPCVQWHTVRYRDSIRRKITRLTVNNIPYKVEHESYATHSHRFPLFTCHWACSC